MMGLLKFWIWHASKTGMTLFWVLACGQNWCDIIIFRQLCTHVQILKIAIDILIISIDILILMKPMKIPPEIFTKLISSPNLFVSDIQNFPLPKPAKTKSPLPQPLKKFLFYLTPNITDINKIMLLPTPSEALLKHFLGFCIYIHAAL